MGDAPAQQPDDGTIASDGATVSSDMEESVGMSDGVVVMHERRIVGELPKQDLTEERIASLMAGQVMRGAAVA